MFRHGILACSLLIAALAAASVQGEEKPAVDIGALVRAFLASDLDTCDKALDAIMVHEPEWSDIQRALKATGRKYEPGSLLEAQVSAEGAPYSFFFAVPKGYDPAKRYPMIVSLTYKEGTAELAKQCFSTYWQVAVDEGYVVIQLPTREKKLFHQGGGYVIMPAVRWALVNLAIDADRIYLAGASYGGMGSMWFATQRADIFAGCIVYPGSFPGDDAGLVANFRYLPMLFWVGEKGQAIWLKGTKKAVEDLKAVGGSAESIIAKGAGHLPDVPGGFDVKATFLKFLVGKKNARPAKWTWHFVDGAFNLSRNVEIMDFEDTTVEFEATSGNIAIKGYDKPMFVYLTDANLKDGRVSIAVDDAEVFNDKPSQDVRLRLMALYAGLTGGNYKYCVEAKKGAKEEE
ncbi:MAG: prolyl oligopeptidase family serine peptidase [Candidatus Brocadiia bacterium]